MIRYFNKGHIYKILEKWSLPSICCKQSYFNKYEHILHHTIGNYYIFYLIQVCFIYAQCACMLNRSHVSRFTFMESLWFISWLSLCPLNSKRQNTVGCTAPLRIFPILGLNRVFYIFLKLGRFHHWVYLEINIRRELLLIRWFSFRINNTVAQRAVAESSYFYIFMTHGCENIDCINWYLNEYYIFCYSFLPKVGEFLASLETLSSCIHNHIFSLTIWVCTLYNKHNN